MKLNRIFIWSVSIMVSLLLFSAGCGPVSEEPVKAKPTGEPAKAPAEIVKKTPEPAKPKPVKPKPAKPEPVSLGLKFTPKDQTVYKLTMETERSLNFEGPTLNKEEFKDSRNYNKVEIKFMQEIESVDEKGNAVVKIKIQDLTYLSIYKNKELMNFNSNRARDRHNPLEKLSGKSYKIKLSPDGRVLQVIDVEKARTAVKGNTSAHKTAQRLLSSDVIKERHSIPALPPADKNQIQIGDNWSYVKVFTFPLLGSRSYEKIYTLTEVKDADNHKIALVKMNAIPAAEDQSDESDASQIQNIFDNTETYTGRLKINLTTGKIETLSEKMKSQWVGVNPTSKEGREPDILTMGAVRAFSLEKIK